MHSWKIALCVVWNIAIIVLGGYIAYVNFQQHDKIDMVFGGFIFIAGLKLFEQKKSAYWLCMVLTACIFAMFYDALRYGALPAFILGGIMFGLWHCRDLYND